MIKQRKLYKQTKLGKRRVNMQEIERDVQVQKRINLHQVRVNQRQDLINDEVDERLRKLELAHSLQTLSWYERFWLWLAR